MNRHETLLNGSSKPLRDANSNGLDDRIEPPEVSIEASAQELRVKLRQNTSTSPELCCGDVDAQWEMGESSGDETAGGSNPTPDQNGVDAIGAAMGVTYADTEELHLMEKEHERDVHRWELDPASSDDWRDRTRKAKAPLSRFVQWVRSHSS
jgi:hypothetical protein